MQDQRSKSTCVGLAMTMLAKVQIPFFVNTMSTHQQKDFDMVKGSAYNCYHPMWNRVMATKMSQIVSWVLLYSLLWSQCKW